MTDRTVICSALRSVVLSDPFSCPKTYGHAMKPHECWAMLLLAIVYTQVQMNASSSLEMAFANATGTGSVPIAAQAAASPDVTADSASERHRCHRSESPKTLDLMGFSRSQENKREFDSRKSRNRGDSVAKAPPKQWQTGGETVEQIRREDGRAVAGGRRAFGKRG